MPVQKQERRRLSPMEKAAQFRAKAAQLEAQAAAEARKLDTRRKILLGGAVLAEARENTNFATMFADIVSRRITKDADAKVVEGWQG